MTTLANFSDLCAEVVSIVGRADVSSTSHLPQCILMTERELNTVLRRREMSQLSTTSTVASQASYALPSDFGDAISLHLNSEPLDVLDPSDWDTEIILHQSQTGKPQRWSVTYNQFLLAPIPDAVYTLELHYYKGIPALTSVAATNWLLTSYPHIYLFGVLMNLGLSYLASDPRLQQWERAFREGVARLIGDQIRERGAGGGPILRADLPFGRGNSFNILTG